MKNEEVLCISLISLEHRFNLKKGYWIIKKDDLIALPYSFILRKDAESDFTYKQIIPYVLVVNTNNQILSYKRCGTEQRLHGLRSAGIGGHINKDDLSATLYETIQNGLRREVYEEIGINIFSEQLSLLGMINEEQTEVGHCHLGVVFVLMLDGNMLTMNEEICECEWTNNSELNTEDFELWSKLAIALFNK